MSYLIKLLTDPEFDVLNNLVRWNGHRKEKDETVAHHTYFVVFFVRMLLELIYGKRMDGETKLRIVDHALFHDFDEIFNFDVNHQVKYNECNGKRMRECITEFTNDAAFRKYVVPHEMEAVNSVERTGDLFMYKNMFDDELLPLAYDIVKVADWYACVFYLSKEKMLGNRGMKREYTHAVQNFKKKCAEVIERYIETENMGYADFTVLREVIAGDFDNIIE